MMSFAFSTCTGFVDVASLSSCVPQKFHYVHDALPEPHARICAVAVIYLCVSDEGHETKTPIPLVPSLQLRYPIKSGAVLTGQGNSSHCCPH